MSIPKWKDTHFRGKLIDTMSKEELLEVIDFLMRKDEEFNKELRELLPELKAAAAIERIRNSGCRTVVVSKERDGWHNLWGLF